MALLEETLFGSHDKVAIALQRLRTFEPPEGYYLAFSGILTLFFGWVEKKLSFYKV